MPVPSRDSAHASLSISDYGTALWRHKAIVGIALLIGIVAGVAALPHFAAAPEYQVTQRVDVKGTTADRLFGAQGLLAQNKNKATAGSTLTQATPLDPSLVPDITALEQVLNQPGSQFGRLEVLHGVKRSLWLGTVAKNLVAVAVPGTTQIDVSFTDPDPQLAADLVGGYVRGYADRRNAADVAITRQAMNNLRGQYDRYYAQVTNLGRQAGAGRRRSGPSARPHRRGLSLDAREPGAPGCRARLQRRRGDLGRRPRGPLNRGSEPRPVARAAEALDGARLGRPARRWRREALRGPVDRSRPRRHRRGHQHRGGHQDAALVGPRMPLGAATRATGVESGGAACLAALPAGDREAPRERLGHHPRYAAGDLVGGRSASRRRGGRRHPGGALRPHQAPRRRRDGGGPARRGPHAARRGPARDQAARPAGASAPREAPRQCPRGRRSAADGDRVVAVGSRRRVRQGRQAPGERAVRAGQGLDQRAHRLSGAG